jgi:hypothetical protein
MTAKKKRMLPRTWARVFFSYGVRSSGMGLVSRFLLWVLTLRCRKYALLVLRCGSAEFESGIRFRFGLGQALDERFYRLGRGLVGGGDG